MQQLLQEIRKCTVCKDHLELGPKPVMVAHKKARIAIIGQAPGTKVHATGIPWNDPSGRQLRKWLQVSDEEFYNEELFAIVPMGFCYPGKGKSGDLPPRSECAPLWHERLFDKMPNLECIILIGQYAQQYYLKEAFKKNLTETVKAFDEYVPRYLVFPHPSPRNRFWMKKNPWFELDVLPYYQTVIQKLLDK